MYALHISLLLLVSSALALLFKAGTWKRFVACGGVVAGSAVGLVPAVRMLRDRAPLIADWGSPIPQLHLSIGLDPLSAFFLVAIFGLSGLVGIYAWGYVKAQPKFLSALPFFPLLVAAMAAVIVARDGLFFLIAWEAMSLASFFLVTAEHERREVRHAGWIYLAATHCSTAFLLVLFAWLFNATGTFAFDGFARLPSLPPATIGCLLLCALLGFGTKAGIFPLHVWLPHAHPAAPSPISALMSGVMIKTGIYGLLRVLTFVGTPPLWWGEFLIGLGIGSAVLGVLYALMQHDLKRLLAYHSVENIGIILTGIGWGCVGLALRQPGLATLGFGGGLLHVVNHAIFKGLLFLGAGNVVHAAGTCAIDRLGGLWKTMPITGATFLIGSVAICGLPPLNGFVSEWLIYVGLLRGVQQLSHTPLFFAIAGIVGIAFAGGLAIACFTKVVGVVFLGEHRGEGDGAAHEGAPVLLVPMGILAALCIGLGVFPQGIWPAVFSVTQTLIPSWSSDGAADVLASLAFVGRVFGIGLFAATLIGLLARWRGRRSPRRSAVTWACGYAAPTARMQYTASSFAEPLGLVFAPLLRPRVHCAKPSGLFPAAAHFAEQTEDLAEARFFAPVFRAIAGAARFIQGTKRGRIHGALMLILVTLILVLLWEGWLGI